MSQKVLLCIVQGWDINENTEYRGFRCASCQKYMYKAWHHWLKEGGYKTPVHFCNDCETKFKSLKIKGIYKTFSCDNCGKNIHKAYHVWGNKDGVLSETHLCKKCSDKLGLGKEIKGVIYDLDGTIVSTQKLHEDAWVHAGKKFNIPITKRMLLNQRGISNKEAVSMMLPNNKKYLIEKFKNAKVQYVNENLNKITLFPYISKTIRQLLKEGYRVWICTSATKDFVKKILKIFKELKEMRDNIVWREMYKKEKPSPEALNLTIKKMDLTKSQVYYIGDALSDYKTSIAAKVKFIYFCPNFKKGDLRIPKLIPTISSHRKIFKLLK